MDWVKRVPAAERRIDRFAGEVAGGFGGDAEGFHALEEGFGFEDHAFASAEGTVVYGAVTVVGELAEIVGGNLQFAAAEGAAENAVVEGSAEKVGEEGDDVEAHGEFATNSRVDADSLRE